MKFSSCFQPTSKCSSAGSHPKCHTNNWSCTCWILSCSKGCVRIPPEKKAEHKGTRGLSAKQHRPGAGNDNNKNIELLFRSEPTYGDSLSWACPAPAARNRCGPVPNSWGRAERPPSLPEQGHQLAPSQHSGARPAPGPDGPNPPGCSPLPQPPKHPNHEGAKATPSYCHCPPVALVE